ncbi:MAG: acyltransferase [Rhizobacter sp.]
MYWSLNSVRAVLSVCVVLYHLGGTIALERYFHFDFFAKIFGFGGARVPFFFVLSGFVLTLAYAKSLDQPGKVWPFLKKRFMRLYPSFWVILLLVMLPAMFVPSLREAIPHDPWQMFKTWALLPQHPGAGWPTGAPVIVAAWTLHYEVVSYLVLAAWIFNRAVGLMLSLLLVANAVACSQWQCGFYGDFLSAGYLLYFAYGAATAWLLRRLPPMKNAMRLAWGALAAYLVVAVVTYENPALDWINDTDLSFTSLACVILLCLANSEDGRPRERNSVWVKLLSDSSYVLYLLHYPVISLVCKLAMAVGLRGAVGAVITFVAALVCCILAAVVFHLFIERRLVSLSWAPPRPTRVPESP